MTRFLFALCSLFAALTTPILAGMELSDDEVLPLLRKNVKGKGDYLKRQLTRLGNKTIQLETFASIEGDIDSASKILADFGRYNEWATENINVKPNGSTYFLKILGIEARPGPLSALGFAFKFDLPVFKHSGTRYFKMRTVKGDRRVSVLAETEPSDESIVKHSEGILKAYAAEDEPGRVWLYVRGHVVIGPWILYEALPEKLINRESGERIQTILNNYQKAEDKMRETKAPVESARADWHPR